MSVLRWLRRLLCWLFRCNEAVRLNLTVTHRTLRISGYNMPVFNHPESLLDMAKIGDSFTARIAPTNAAGGPAPVFNVIYSESGDSYDISVAPDGLTAVLVAKSAGTDNVVHVEATTKGGALLFATAALPDVEAAVDEEAVKLNLTIE